MKENLDFNFAEENDALDGEQECLEIEVFLLIILAVRGVEAWWLLMRLRRFLNFKGDLLVKESLFWNFDIIDSKGFFVSFEFIFNFI
jgi:hypothetical protein